MATLVAIGYDHEETAAMAAAEVRRLSRELIIEPDAVAVIKRDAGGHYHVSTSHHAVGIGTSWGMFWGLLFGLLFFVPVFGLAVGAGIGALFGKIEKSGIDKEFQEQVREMVRPGTSALFLIIEKATPEEAVAALGRFGGTVLKSSLTEEDQKRLQEELSGKVAATSA
jgi:uncharacterized membrane protein